MRDFISITKALSDENRVRILMMLCSGELCACQIIDVLGLAPSTVSKHLSILRQARLIDARKEGRWVYYRLPGKSAPPVVSEAIRWVRSSLKGDERAREDAKRIEAISKAPGELCG